MGFQKMSGRIKCVRLCQRVLLSFGNQRGRIGYDGACGSDYRLDCGLGFGIRTQNLSARNHWNMQQI